MTKPRDIGKVINDILAQVPSAETEMRAALERVYDKATYTAPEIMHQRWGDLSYLVSRYCPGYEDLTAWQRKCVDILMGTTQAPQTLREGESA